MPKVILGTNRPSMTSKWIKSTPARSAAAICSPSLSRSEERIDGPIQIGPVVTITSLLRSRVRAARPRTIPNPGESDGHSCATLAENPDCHRPGDQRPQLACCLVWAGTCPISYVLPTLARLHHRDRRPHSVDDRHVSLSALGTPCHCPVPCLDPDLVGLRSGQQPAWELGLHPSAPLPVARVPGRGKPRILDGGAGNLRDVRVRPGDHPE